MKKQIKLLCMLFGFTVIFTFYEVHAHDGRTTLGLGLGVPYGVLGVNLNFPVSKDFYLTAGLGTSIVADTAFSVGAQYYFKENTDFWRPRIGAYYGTNSAIKIEQLSYNDDYDDSKSYKGLSVGLGASWIFGGDSHHGMDADIIYIVTNGDFDDDVDQLEEMGYEIDEGMGGKIKFSFGYQYHF